MARRKETSLFNLIYHTEQPTWVSMSAEHKGYRTALWRLLADNMYSVGDYYVPVEEVFFGTTILADRVLETIISQYDFKRPKKIIVQQPRYQTNEHAGDYVDIPDYTEKHPEAEFLFTGEKFRIAISEEENQFIVTILL